MADERDQPDPSLPLKEDRIGLYLDDLTPAQASELIEREAAKLIDPKIDIDRDSWELFGLVGQRHMTPREFEDDRDGKARQQAEREKLDRAALERIRAEHPEWLTAPPAEPE